MKIILKVKELLKNFYERYGRYFNMLIRFCFSLLLYLTIMYHAGYNPTVTNPYIALLLAVVSAFFPTSAISVFGSLLIVLEFAAVAIEIAIVTGVLMLVMLLMYFIFRAGDSYVMSLTLLLCLWSFSPAILPLALLIQPAQVLVTVFGVILYGVIIVVKKDVSVLAGESAAMTLGNRINLLLNDLFTNPRFYLILIALVVAMILCSVIRHSKINYAALLALVVGDSTFLILYLLGAYFMNVSIDMVSFIIAFLLNLLSGGFILNFVLNADYNRVEEVNFEDEEYYYFVKAIPKTSISLTERKVENITAVKSDTEESEIETFDFNDVFKKHDQET